MVLDNFEKQLSKNSKSSLFCRLCEDNVVDSNGGYYSLAFANARKLNIRGKTSVLFDVEYNLSVRPSVLKTTDKRMSRM